MKILIAWLLLLYISLCAAFGKDSEETKSWDAPSLDSDSLFKPEKDEAKTRSEKVNKQESVEHMESMASMASMASMEDMPSTETDMPSLETERGDMIRCPLIFCQDGCFPAKRDRSTGCKLSCICSDKKPGGPSAPTGTLPIHPKIKHSSRDFDYGDYERPRGNKHRDFIRFRQDDKANDKADDGADDKEDRKGNKNKEDKKEDKIKEDKKEDKIKEDKKGDKNKEQSEESSSESIISESEDSDNYEKR